MERGVVHYNHSAFVKGRQELADKPGFKETAVHRPAILEWRKDLILHFCGDNATAFIFPPTDQPRHFLALRGIPVFPVQIRINAAFIYISDLLRRHVLDLFFVRFYFLLVLLLVPGCLFFLVILFRRSASRMPLSLHPNACAISDWYASGCSAT